MKKKKVLPLICIVIIISVIYIIISKFNKNIVEISSEDLQNIGARYIEEKSDMSNINKDNETVSIQTLIDKNYIKENQVTRDQKEKGLIQVNKLNDTEKSTSLIYESSLLEDDNTIEVKGYEGTTYNAKVTKYSEDSETQFTTETEDGEKIYKINSKSKTKSYYKLSISGMDDQKIYLAKAKIKTTDVQTNGANMGGQLADNNMWSYSLKSIKGTEGWTDVTIPLKTNYGSDKLEFCLSLGGGVKEEEKASGTVEFKDIQVYESDQIQQNEDKLKIITSDNNKVKWICYNTYYDQYAQGKEQKVQDRVNYLGEAYEGYAEYVGNTSKTEELMYPYGGNPIIIFETNVPYWGAGMWSSTDHIVAGVFSSKSDMFSDEPGNVLNFGYIHEIGHSFDNALTSSDGVKTNVGKWNFHSEFFANVKIMYVLDNNKNENNRGIRVMSNQVSGGQDYQALIDSWINSYNNMMESKIIKLDGLEYILYKDLTFEDGTVDWNAFKEMFKWFNDSNENFSYIEKLTYFIKKLDDFSEIDLRSKLTDEEIEIITTTNESGTIPESNKGAYFKKVTSINSNNEMKLAYNNEYTNLFSFNPDDTTDFLVYKSSDENIARVDNNGKITTGFKGGNVTFTVTPYFYKTPQLTITKNVEAPFVQMSEVSSNIGKIYEDIRQKLTVNIQDKNIDLKESRINVKIKKDNVDLTDDFTINISDNDESFIQIETPYKMKKGTYCIEVYCEGEKIGEKDFEAKEITYTNITTKEQFLNISNTQIDNENPKFYKLINDLDFGNEPMNIISNFCGILDGNGHTLKGININHKPGQTATGSGLIGKISTNSSAVIRNISIKDSSIIGQMALVGGYIGNVESGSFVNIENVSNDAYVQGNGTNVGGIIGLANGNVCINKVFNSGTIETLNHSSPSGLGGIAGGVSDTTQITNVFNTGKIIEPTDESYGGGIVGDTSSKIEIKNAYNLDSINRGIVGSMVRYNNEPQQIKNVYTISGTTVIGDDTFSENVKTREELKLQETYKGFDFTNVWELKEGTYPTLKDVEYNYIKDVQGRTIYVEEGTELNINDIVEKSSKITPTNATKKKIKYELSDINNVNVNDENKTIVVNKGGSIVIKCNTTDGSDLQYQIKVCDNIDEITEIEKSSDNSTIDITVNLKDSGENAEYEMKLYEVGQESTMLQTYKGQSNNKRFNNLKADTQYMIKIKVTTNQSIVERTEYIYTKPNPPTVKINEIELEKTSKSPTEIKVGADTKIIFDVEGGENGKYMIDSGIWIDIENNKIQLNDINNGNHTLKVKSLSEKTGLEQDRIYYIKIIKLAQKINIEGKSIIDLTELKTAKLTAIVKPDDAENKQIDWSSNNEKIASIDQNGLVTGKEVGDITITATAKDESKVYGTYNISIIETDKTNPVIENIIKEQTTNTITISIEATDKDKDLTYKIELYDANQKDEVLQTYEGKDYTNIFRNLNPDTHYIAKITVTDTSGNKTEKEEDIYTIPVMPILKINDMELSKDSDNPTKIKFSKNDKIRFNVENGVNNKYSLNEGVSWENVTENIIDVNAKEGIYKIYIKAKGEESKLESETNIYVVNFVKEEEIIQSDEDKDDNNKSTTESKKAEKEDATLAKTILPNTGMRKVIIIIGIILIGTIIFIKKYRNLKDIK